MATPVTIIFCPEYLTLKDADDKDLGTSAALMLSTLASLVAANADERGWVEMTAAQGEDLTGFSHDTQKRLRERLMAAGYIRFRFKGQGAACQYYVCTHFAYKPGVSGETVVSTQNAYKQGQKAEVTTQIAYKGEELPPSSPPPVSPSNSLSDLPPIIPPSPEGKKTQRGAGESETSEFQAFYDAYPRKVARPKAMAAWNRLKPNAEMTARIMAGLQKSMREWRRDEPEFIPHPATWLNQRRWEDEGLALDFQTTRGSPSRLETTPVLTAEQKQQRILDQMQRVAQRNGVAT